MIVCKFKNCEIVFIFNLNLIDNNKIIITIIIIIITIINNRSRKKCSVVKEGLIKFIIFAKI